MSLNSEMSFNPLIPLKKWLVPKLKPSQKNDYPHQHKVKYSNRNLKRNSNLTKIYKNLVLPTIIYRFNVKRLNFSLSVILKKQVGTNLKNKCKL